MFDYLVTMHQFKLNLKLILNFFLDVSILYWHIILVNNYSLKWVKLFIRIWPARYISVSFISEKFQSFVESTNHIIMRGMGNAHLKGVGTTKSIIVYGISNYKLWCEVFQEWC